MPGTIVDDPCINQNLCFFSREILRAQSSHISSKQLKWCTGNRISLVCFWKLPVWRVARPDLPVILLTSGYVPSYIQREICRTGANTILPWNLVGKPSNTGCNVMTVQLTSSFWRGHSHRDVHRRFQIIVDDCKCWPIISTALSATVHLIQTGNLRLPLLVLSPTRMVLLLSSTICCWKFLQGVLLNPSRTGSKACKLQPCA